jgi:CTP:molybdopterin cytidylyltransferase MocA
MGQPKALLCDDAGVPYLDRAIGTLFEGGCVDVTVVLGAAADEAMEILRVHGWVDCHDVSILVNDDWAEGMGSSLRTGLAALDSEAALVMLVDLPDVHDDAVRRLLEGAAPDALLRATYAGKPGHPVLIGREHWAAVIETAEGDRGARAYLDQNGVLEIPCDDLATGRDLDRPEDLGA